MTLSNEIRKADALASESTPLKFFSSRNSRSKSISAQDDIDLLYEISLLLDTGVDKDAISLCLKLCDNGVNPEALANTIRDLKDRAISQGNINTA
ncbi:mitotic-spindle organizing gamma-tubulin ring associated-domain-containing protein [Lipomyces tetrasporus]|uniref:Mitotic-spindle organizing protein 1 n=1 Tax=Lipomyces tetrasporus TaxID=54092 RepID=A0AAD7QVF8_9ASCO|nr:mitotic-spindle organizing gamma-tubulin ring associated-domain-containing protein [Lipomyces tetrasporus]KAJ8101911.1 mitotic-spindle organizing gamma-tubulin ring associated-domain-containing protein [Lipomyces tetrasporus]